MAGIAPPLLPPLYGIVYEYLTPSEQWYVRETQSQFRAVKTDKKATEADIIKDAIANDHLHIFLYAREKMSPHVTQLDNVARMLIEYDRIDMFGTYAKNKRIIKSMASEIMKYGAIKIMRNAHQRRIRQFHHAAGHAAVGGHLQCLQALVETEPIYKGAGDGDVYCSAVASDDVNVVKFVTENWPLSLEYKVAGVNGNAPLTSGAMGGYYAKSAVMAKYLLDNWHSCSRRLMLMTSLCCNALANDSVEILKVVMKDASFAEISIPGIYEANPNDIRLTKTSAVYRYLESEGVFDPAG